MQRMQAHATVKRVMVGLTVVLLLGVFSVGPWSGADVTQAQYAVDYANSAQQGADLEVREIPAEEGQRAEEFWTEERMRQAEPATPGIQGRPPGPQEAETPRPGANRVSGEGSLPTEGAGINEPILATDASPVQGNYTRYPIRAMGRVFFVRNGSGFSCSAAVINTEGKSLVWTAGHCVGRNGSWARNWIFVPGYKNGNAPFGRWSARQLWTFTGWFANDNFNYDLGAAVMNPKNGRRLGNVVGSLGWAFNFPRNQEFSEFGYASAGNNYNGLLSIRCNDPYSGAYGRSNPGPAMSTNKCDFTAGASGGPWVLDFEACPNCNINSVNSLWWFPDSQNFAYQWAGPYHGNAAFKLYREAQR